MDNISFTLNTADIEKISDALTEMTDCVELISIFSILEMQGSPITVATKEQPSLADFLGDFRETDDDFAEVTFKDVEFTQDFDTPDEPRDIFAELAEEHPELELDPKIKLMVQDPTPVATPVDEPEPKPEPKSTVVHGWDARVPKPTPDPDLMAQVNPIPTPTVVNPATPGPTPEGMEKVEGSHGYGFRPIPNEIKPTPKPEPEPAKNVEPDFDKDDVCLDCGGFTEENPHSDPSMNCECEPEPDAVEDDIRVKGSEEMRENLTQPKDEDTFGSPHGYNPNEPPEPEVTPAQEAGVSPSGGWTTASPNPATDPNIWRT